MTYNVRNIAIALVLAGIAAFLVIMYTGNVQKQAHNSQQATTVLIANADIPAGTSVADAISGGQIQPRQIVQQDVIVGALTDEKSLDSSYVTKQDMYAGQQVTAAMFSPSTDTRHDGADQGQLPRHAVRPHRRSDPGRHPAGRRPCRPGGHLHRAPANGDPDFDVSRIIVRDLVVLKAPATDSTTGKLDRHERQAAGDPRRCPTRSRPRSPSRMHAGDDALWLVLRPGNGSQDGPISLATVKSVIFDGPQRPPDRPGPSVTRGDWTMSVSPIKVFITGAANGLAEVSGGSRRPSRGGACRHRG